jgi:hypothetical protein
MAELDKATETQLANIRKKTGKAPEELFAVLRASGLEKHGALRDKLKADLGMGHGDANLIVHLFRQADEGGAATAEADPLDAIYAGPKAALRPIHERLLAEIGALGPFEVAPKKAYVSLRRAKQFATVGPPAKNRVEVGLNMKGVEPTDRLLAIPPGGMCQYKVNVTDPGQVDAELMEWIRRAYEASA